MKIIYAIATLAGTIIGVGFFALPYVTLKVGFWVILGYFLVLGFLVILIHQFFAELALKTPDYKRFPGFAKIYLGNWGEKIAYFSTILGIFGAILAYLIVGGEFLTELFLPIFGGNSPIYTLFYFIAGALLIFFGRKAVAKMEFWGLILFFIVLILIFFRGKYLINIDNLFPVDWLLKIENLFLPYGIILFSLWGAALIPEIEEMLGEKKQLIKKIIPISIIITILVYLFFIYLILGITGPQTTESALVGLRNFLGDGIVNLGLFFGILTTFTSFIALGLTLKKVFCYDLKIGKNLAWAITCFVPLILFLIGIKQFIPVIAFVGAVMLGIDGILILLMYQKINPPKFKRILIYPLFFILFLGIFYEIFYFLK
ncbi:MAG: aromatic amino acid transport family protein [Minisyncoccales bacterium]